MIRTLPLVLLLTACAYGAPAQTLFNGENLDGWEGNTELWRVEDGVIVGETTAEKKASGNTFLIWKGGEVGDFTLTLKARVTGNNSGVQYRSKLVDAKNWVVSGYQMDMHPSPDYLGMLYEEKGRGIVAQRGQQVIIDETGKKHVVGALDKSDKIDLAQWNDYKLVVKGNRIEHFVNGKPTARIIDNENSKRALTGVLALQLHAGPAMRAEFKDFRLFNKLPKTTTISAVTKPVQAPKSLAKLKAPATPQWIWTTQTAKDETIYARRQWTLSAPLKAAKLSITCDNGFTAFINGQKIGGGNEWSNHYQYDIKKHLRNGDNVLAVEATNEGAQAGLVARISMTDASGRQADIVTDKEWHVTGKKAEGWMAPSIDTEGWARPVIVGKMGDQPWGDVFSGKAGRPVTVTNGPPRVPEGFEIEKIYTVPKGQQGSWVSMAVDDKGRLYCGDQGGNGIFRVTLGEGEPKIEKVPAAITGAHGLLWAFDSLYVCVNERRPAGLFRLTDSDGDDALDKVEHLRTLQGGGEHGPHAVALAPDGQSLFVLGGNHTKTPDPESSAVVPNYGEDQLLPRMPDANGHAASIRAPGGWIARTDKDGKAFELYSAGFRNQYDIAFNADGEMFTYDSDMEWDIGTPWYRPTRVYHVTSGSEFGWRTGTGKFPSWYPDTLPGLDIGPGSPTGVVSGLGAKFPVKYQDAIYAFDWTYGTIYAIHLTPNGGSYDMTKEEFVVGVPLNVTDGVIGKDGNFYFAVGGRGTNSALYRVKYTGDENTTWKARGNKLASSIRALRNEMEKFHGKQVAGSVDKIWPNLGHQDRHVRFAARVALEHQPVTGWADKALGEKDPQTALSALLALSRQGDKSLQPELLDALAALPAADLTEAQKLESLRVLGLCIIRMGKPDAETTSAEIVAALSPHYPAPSDALNRELVALLVTLGDPSVVAKTIPLLNQEAASVEGLELSDEFLARSGYGKAFAATRNSNPQRQQIWYAYALKNVTEGWTPELRKEFFTWFAKSLNFKGGNSFGGFIRNFRKEALAKIPDAKLRAEMDALSKAPLPLVPEGFADARELKVGVKAVLKFDVEKLEAKAGEKVVIVLLNNDAAPLAHNLAICAPGSREKVVAAALTIGAKAIEQNFVPDLPEVLASTPQIAPGRIFKLYFTVPSTPGDYPYVCTYPGHGQLMHGVLTVTQ